MKYAGRPTPLWKLVKTYKIVLIRTLTKVADQVCGRPTLLWPYQKMRKLTDIAHL